MIRVRTQIVATVLSLVVIVGGASVASAQLHPPEFKGLRGAAFPSMNPPPDVRSFGEGPAWDGKPPDGIQPLPLDMFTSKDFYKDKALWLDKRYYRCNSPRQITDMRSGGAGQPSRSRVARFFRMRGGVARGSLAERFRCRSASLRARAGFAARNRCNQGRPSRDVALRGSPRPIRAGRLGRDDRSAV